MIPTYTEQKPHEQQRKVRANKAKNQNGNNQDYLPHDYDIDPTIDNYKNLLKEK